jgi:hypothetical protein
MLRGIDTNPIVAGAYVDRASGGICPMLAAHRNGGRTSLASFARAWDRYTGARRPRLATRRELRTLRVLLVSSIASDLGGPERGSLAEAGARIRAERSANAAARKPAPETGERHRGAELRSRLRWAWVRPARRYDAYGDLLAAAEAELTEARAGDHGGEREPAGTR